MRTKGYAKKDMKNIKGTSEKMTPDNWVFVSSVYCNCNVCVKYGCADKPVIFVNPKVMHLKSEDSTEPVNLGNVPIATPKPPSEPKKVPVLPIGEFKKKETVVIIRKGPLTQPFMGTVTRRKIIPASCPNLAALLNAK